MNEQLLDPASSGAARKIGQLITNNFEDVTCCVLPYPGEAIVEFSRKLDDKLNKAFVAETNAFMTTVLQNLRNVTAKNNQVKYVNS